MFISEKSLLASMAIWTCLAWGNFACQRAETTSSEVSLSVPASMQFQKAGALSETLTPMHIIINITGEGLKSPLLLTWDQCGNCETPNPLPSNFTADLPSGKNRLVQVLAVYGVENSDGFTRSEFFYQDATLDMLEARVNLELQLQSLPGANAGTLTSGQVSGRLMSDATSGPTGLVQIRFQLPGKPSMVISKTWMSNGWFSFFMM